jgi:hypothetical protein
MPNLNPRDARTYDPAPTLWKYDPQTNILWLKLTDASTNTSVVSDQPHAVSPVSRPHRRSLTYRQIRRAPD